MEAIVAAHFAISADAAATRHRLPNVEWLMHPMDCHALMMAVAVKVVGSVLVD